MTAWLVVLQIFQGILGMLIGCLTVIWNARKAAVIFAA